MASVIASGLTLRHPGGTTPQNPPEASVRTVRGLQVDLRVVPLDAWGAALQYFTGSTAHNVAVRLGRYPASFGKMTSKRTCTRTPTSPTG